jgi:protein SCO1/2
MRAALLAVLVLLWSGTGLRAADKLPAEYEGLRFEQRLGAQAPLDVEFRDETGAAVRLGRYFDGKPVVLVLAYIRCPRLCSVVLRGVAEGLRGVPFDAGKDFRVVVVSFDPREGPEIAAAAKTSYAAHYGRATGEEGWHFLTGKEADIRRLADAVGFRYVYDARRDEYRHASGILLLTPQGRVGRYLFGLAYSARDLRLGLVEASEGKIGSAVDDALLFGCFSYDPEMGRYSVAALKLVRLGGVLTVLILAVWLGTAWRRERRKARAAQNPAPGEPGA